MSELHQTESASQVRAIVHLDLDAFFAAVEVLDRPKLKDKPVLIGGRPGQRGVVATASYKARKYGIHSAMPMSQALRLCPHAVVLPANHTRYRECSRSVMAILRHACDLVEQVSIDEAYLDLSSQISDWPEAVERARALQQAVAAEVTLSASLGVATNKLVAKVASDREKPGGLTVVLPGEEAVFLAPLPTRVLWGVGPVTTQRLQDVGIATVGELARSSPASLRAQLGRHSAGLVRQAQGIDHRPVNSEHERKSISQERTFSRDIADPVQLREQLGKMSERVAAYLRRADRAAGTVAIKLRYSDFETLSRQTTLSMPTDDAETIYRSALALLRKTWQRGRRVRLLGVAARNLSTPSGQMSLWP